MYRAAIGAGYSTDIVETTYLTALIVPALAAVRQNYDDYASVVRCFCGAVVS